MAKAKEDVWVSYTCANKKCESAFMNKDELNTQNDSPDYKYCPECVKAGFRNTLELKEAYKKWVAFMDRYMAYEDEHGKFNEIQEDFLKKKAKQLMVERIKHGVNTNAKGILREIIEIMSYYDSDSAIPKLNHVVL